MSEDRIVYASWLIGLAGIGACFLAPRVAWPIAVVACTSLVMNLVLVWRKK